MVEYFINGGPFMWPILILLLAGFGIVGERFYSLISSSIDTSKFFEDVEETLNNNGVDATLELCNNTEGPVAQIFSAGLSRIDRGLEEAEKAISNAASLEMSFLEKNMIWLNAVITIAPMLGFTGTVAGMVNAFDAIAAANDISPAVVAGGISVALLTTAFGLVVAVILQIFQNAVLYIIDNQIVTLQKSTTVLLHAIKDMGKN